jgi:hypothetical protein
MREHNRVLQHAGTQVSCRWFYKLISLSELGSE